MVEALKDYYQPYAENYRPFLTPLTGPASLRPAVAIIRSLLIDDTLWSSYSAAEIPSSKPSKRKAAFMHAAACNCSYHQGKHDDKEDPDTGYPMLRPEPDPPRLDTAPLVTWDLADCSAPPLVFVSGATGSQFSQLQSFYDAEETCLIVRGTIDTHRWVYRPTEDPEVERRNDAGQQRPRPKRPERSLTSCGHRRRKPEHTPVNCTAK